MKKGRVYVGLSGGVDSSLSAALLTKAGYDVTGVFIKVWQPDWITCTWKEDRLDAMRVCATLGIPFVTLDLEKEYKKDVVDYMIAEYKAGRTPNPDVMCNRHVKFGAFYDWAMTQGAQYVATGHYAQILPTNDQKSLFTLSTAKDANKDQSYFLWTIKQEQLPHVLFPIGHLEKTEVRRLARKYGLITADKKDSQGLCFIGKVDMKEFLKTFIPEKKGVVLNEKGETIGEHDGATFLTIGERHGFTVTRKTSEDEAYYVLSKDINKNTITVSHKLPSGALSETTDHTVLTHMNWITTPDSDKTYHARARYRAPLFDCHIDAARGEARFSIPQSTITPGQSLVVYDGELCLGGGIIS